MQPGLGIWRCGPWQGPRPSRDRSPTLPTCLPCPGEGGKEAMPCLLGGKKLWWDFTRPLAGVSTAVPQCQQGFCRPVLPLVLPPSINDTPFSPAIKHSVFLGYFPLLPRFFVPLTLSSSVSRDFERARWSSHTLGLV